MSACYSVSCFCKRAACRLRCCESTDPRGFPMPRYRVTLRRSSVEIVEASNQYQAAIVARDLFGDSVEVADVRPAVGRPPRPQGCRKPSRPRRRRRSRRSAGRSRPRRRRSSRRTSSRPAPPARPRPEPPSARPRRRSPRRRQPTRREEALTVTAQKYDRGHISPPKWFTRSIDAPIDNRHPYSVADNTSTLCLQSGRLGSGERMAKPAS